MKNSTEGTLEKVVDIKTGRYAGKWGYISEIVSNTLVKVKLLADKQERTVRVNINKLANFRDMEW